MNNLGEKPVLMWVPVDSLYVDHSYQRTISTKKGEKVISDIVLKFNWPLFQPITITEREEGGYWVIDGQHRFTAAQRLKIREIPAALVDLPTSHEKANAFVQINAARVSINALAVHHAKVVAGDPMAVRLQVCCDKAKVEIPRYPKMVNIIKPNESMAVKQMITVMGALGDDALIWSLRILRRAYPDVSGGLSSQFIRLLSNFYNTYQDVHISEDDLVSVLADCCYEDLIDEAREISGKNSQQTTVRDVIQVLINAYNDICEERKRLPSISTFKELSR